MKLPSLKKWRIRRGLTQAELARLAGFPEKSLPRIERGERGCTIATAQKLAEALGVDWRELEKPSPQVKTSKGRPRGSHQNLYRPQLKRLLDLAVGSSYMAMPEKELERHCRTLSWEEVIEVVSAREREAKVLKSELDLEDANFLPEEQGFFERVLRSFPDQDICLLAAARRREETERGREELTRKMRLLV